jgi:hypothetical protein
MTGHRIEGVAAEESHEKRKVSLFSVRLLGWVEGKDMSLGELYRIKMQVAKVRSYLGARCRVQSGSK